MTLLKPLGSGPGYLKAGFLGFTATGKTHTASLLAIAMKRQVKHAGPIAFYDTETGSDYVTPMIHSLTGQDPLGIKSRDFSELLSVGNECIAAGVSVLLVDSVTHIWRTLCDSYLAGVNKAREELCREKNWRFKPRTGLEFQDWGPIKATWARWTDFYLTAPIHIVICGRAGFEYDYEVNEQTQKRELIKTGTKMKTESEFGFEPSLLIEMEVENEKTPDGERQIRTAFIRKDRFNVMDGMLGRFPSTRVPEEELAAVVNFFAPHIGKLNPATHTSFSTTAKPMEVNGAGSDEWHRERQTRIILCEEIQGVLTSAIPGQTADEKKRKADQLQKHFGTRSWTAIENLNSEKLRAGLAAMKTEVEGAT